MSQAPAWLVFATPTVALLALVVAIASFCVAFATYRRAGPRVQVRTAFVVPKSSGQTARVSLHILNKGIAKVYVRSILIECPIFFGFIVTDVNESGYLADSSFWIDGGESRWVNWIGDPEPVEYHQPGRSIAMVQLGNGQSITAPVQVV